jgi:hypothetical protein
MISSQFPMVPDRFPEPVPMVPARFSGNRGTGTGTHEVVPGTDPSPSGALSLASGLSSVASLEGASASFASTAPTTKPRGAKASASTSTSNSAISRRSSARESSRSLRALAFLGVLREGGRVAHPSRRSAACSAKGVR